MTNEIARLTSDQALECVERDRMIDGVFAQIAAGEEPSAELNVDYLKEVLIDAGADFETVDLEKAKVSLAKDKYKNRRAGLIMIWGERAIIEFEDWAQEVSVLTCPKFENYGEESRSFGLKQTLAEMTAVVCGEMDSRDLVRKTAKRVNFGTAYPTVKKSEDPVEYQRQRGAYEALKGKSKLSNIPPGSLNDFWMAVRSGTLFPAE